MKTDIVNSEGTGCVSCSEKIDIPTKTFYASYGPWGGMDAVETVAEFGPYECPYTLHIQGYADDYLWFYVDGEEGVNLGEATINTWTNNKYVLPRGKRASLKVDNIKGYLHYWSNYIGYPPTAEPKAELRLKASD